MGSERKRINHIAIIEECPSQINSSAQDRKARAVQKLVRHIYFKIHLFESRNPVPRYLGILWGVKNK